MQGPPRLRALSADGSDDEPPGQEYQPTMVVTLPLDQLVEPPDERATRRHYDADALDELAASLLTHGLLQPIGVRPLAADRFEIVYGTRRARAARLAGWTAIACTLRVDLADDQAYVLALAENLQRRELSGAERAHSLRMLAALHVPGRGGGDPEPNSSRGLARRLGVAHQTVDRWLGLANAPEVLEAVEDERIDFSYGLVVARAPFDHRQQVLNEVERGELSYDAVQQRVRELHIGRPHVSAQVRALRQALTALERVDRLPTEAAVELADQVYRHASRLRRLTPPVAKTRRRRL